MANVGAYAFNREAFLQSIIEGVQRLASAPDSELTERSIRELDTFVWNLPQVWDGGNE